MQIRALGALDVVVTGQGTAAGLMARPKPLGVLLHLVLAGTAGSQRRDSLLERFWPDSSTERARSSLRQAIYQLRQALGPDVVASRGEDVLLRPGVVWCDAMEFERRLADGDAIGAMELYRGELLPGFFVDGAPAFERWLDDARRRLRDAARSAAWSLADAAEHSGDEAAALAWCRRVVELAPEDEPAVRRLIAMLRQTGDRAGAMREYDSFAQRMRDEYELEPSAETEALVDMMRGSAGSELRDGSRLDERRVLVTTFDDESGLGALRSFGRLVADAVAQSIASLDGVQVVPLTATLASARHVDAVSAGATAATRARLVGEDLGAGTVVRGAYYAAGDELMVQGWIEDARDGRTLGPLGPVRASLASPLRAAEALSDQARTSLALMFETRVVHIRAARRAPSYEAQGAYVEGLARFVDGDWHGALQHLERSAASDARYSLPLIVTAIARWNLGELAAAEAAVQRARPLAADAGPFERALLDMVRAWLAGDWGAAYEAGRRQAELAPGSIAVFGMAEDSRRRNRPREALRLLATLDPMRGEMRGFAFYWVVMAQALHALAEHRRELDAARRARELHPDSSLALQLEIHARAALGDVPGVRGCIDERLATPGRQEPGAGALMREAALELRAHGHDAATADELLRQCLAWYEELPAEERERPPVQRATARARYDVGDWEGATAAFTALAGERVVVADCGSVHHSHLQAHLDHGYLGVLAIRRGDTAEAARIDGLLERERGEHLFGSTHYWRAAMAALRGDVAMTVRLLRRALAAGMPFEAFIHADPHFSALRGIAELESVLVPRA